MSNVGVRVWNAVDFSHGDLDIGGFVLGVAWSRQGRILAAASHEISVWDIDNTQSLYTFELGVNHVAWSPDSQWITAPSSDGTIRVWNSKNGEERVILEGHTETVNYLAFSSEGRVLVSSSIDENKVRLWRCDTWSPVVSFNVPGAGSLAFHPENSRLAVATNHGIELFDLDIDLLLTQTAKPPAAYTSAKIVLVGDSGVGKTGLGWRLAHGSFKEHASTHGQQFWVLDQLRTTRDDGMQCEAILWDLAGQPDYRVIHALSLEDADLALVLFDPTRGDEPLKGVEYWLKQLGSRALLVGARSDRGTARLTHEELSAYVQRRNLLGWMYTSAYTGDGLPELIAKIQQSIDWNRKPATITTTTFKNIKDYVLRLKENTRRNKKVILTAAELRTRLQRAHKRWKFSDDEMLTAIGHAANHGYVSKLKSSKGETSILLAPELLNNVAASLVLKARANPKGLGSLEEQSILSGEYESPALANLSARERDILLDSAASKLLEFHICFRENDPLTSRAYLIFPELINLKKPLLDDEKPTEEGVAYTVIGAIENVYASLVVLLGYTQTFTRTAQWQNHARYEVGEGLVCGFRLEEEREGELDFVLYFGTDVGEPVRGLFQNLFEAFLARRNLTVYRYEPVSCKNEHRLNRAVVRQRSALGFAFCNECGERMTLPKSDKPIQLIRSQLADVAAAELRSRFEHALFRLKAFITDAKKPVPSCFVSYAWDNGPHDRWVERELVSDLRKAGINVVFDRSDNARIGASILRFVELIGTCDRVIVVGTPLYRIKYDTGLIVAAEGDLIGQRMLGAESKKETVLPVLREGTEETSFPFDLQKRVYADFTRSETYFHEFMNLAFTLYDMNPQDPIAMELVQSLQAANLR
jgi:GTPase SAR1 family protein